MYKLIQQQKALLLSLCSFSLLAGLSLSLSVNAQTNADIALSPTLFANEIVKPKVILSVDNSGSMLNRAYKSNDGNDYNADVDYSGFFEVSGCYSYSTSGDYFQVDAARASPNCGSGSNLSNRRWSGNFLNWLTTRRIDVVRNTLIGGIVKIVIDGSENTRREGLINLASDVTKSVDYYIVEGEETPIWFNGRDIFDPGRVRDNAATSNITERGGADINKLSITSSDQFSPYRDDSRYRAAYSVCGQKILVNKRGGYINDVDIDRRCNDTAMDYTNNNGRSRSGVAEFRIRLRKEANDAPTGLLISGTDNYDFGVAVYNFNHASNAGFAQNCPNSTFQRRFAGSGDSNKCNYFNSIYRGNTRTDGGTLQPCYPDESLPPNARSNYDKCFQTYAGAPVGDLVDVIEFYPLIWGTTPIAETMVEIAGYIKQIDYGRPSKGPQYYDAAHTAQVNTAPEAGAEFDASYRLADVANGVNLEWDPYYDQASSSYLPCTQVYIVNLNDGEPFNDFNGPAGNHPFYDQLWKRNPLSGSGNAASEEVDSVTWSLRGDCRRSTTSGGVDQLPGNQDIISYFVFADLSRSLSGSSQAARKMREAAAVGGAGILEDTTSPGTFKFTDSPFIPGRPNSDPFNGTSDDSGLERVNPQTATSWDKDGDGEPNNFLLATSQEELINKLSSVLADIGRRTAASSSAAVVTNGTAGAGAIYQALYHPNLKANDPVNPSVSWSGSLWGLFLDGDAEFREDTNANGALDADDLVLSYGLSSTTGLVEVTRSNKSTGTQVGLTVGIESVKPIWNALDYLDSVANPTTQRVYTSINPGRYILVGDADLVTETNFTSLARSEDFVVANFDYNDASWFNLDCSLLSNADCTTEVRDLINYLRGDETQGPAKRNRTIDIEGDFDALGNERGELKRILGDIVASSPAVAGTPNQSFNDPDYTSFRLQYANRRQMVYVGANDGMLHAFNGGFYDASNLQFRKDSPFNSSAAEHELGAEMWAYVPRNLLPHLKWLDDLDYQHVFYMDGDPQVFDAKIFADDAVHTGGWGTILVATMRMGGVPATVVDGGNTFTARSAVVVLDVTDPESPPVLLGEFTDDELGFTTSKPAIVNKVSSTSSEWTLVFGSGPTELLSSSVSPGKKPFIYSLDLKKLVADARSTAERSQVGTVSDPDGFVGDITAVDWDLNDQADGFQTDNIFFGTIEANDPLVSPNSPFSGRLYGDILPTTLSNGSFSPQLFYAPPSGDNQPITVAPNYFVDGINRWVYFGTGKLMTPSDNTTTDQQSFYGLKFSDTFPVSGTIFNTTGVSVEAPSGNLTCVPLSSCPNGATNFSGVEAAVADASTAGWRIDLENGVSSSDPSGRSVGNSVLTNGLVLFTDYVPPANVCEVDGVTFLYVLDATTGTSTPFAPLNTVDGSGSGTAKAFTKFGNGQVKGIAVVAGSDNTPAVIAQDSTGSVISQDINLGAATVSPAGRVSWRQIIIN